MDRLIYYPGKAPNNKKFLAQVSKKVEGEEIGLVSADRYKQKYTEEYIDAAELGWVVDWRGVGRGQDGSADILSFQAEVLEGILETEESLLMDSAIAESVLHRDANRNPALNKARHKGRNDPLQASLLAVGPARRWREKMEEVGEFAVNEYIV